MPKIIFTFLFLFMAGISYSQLYQGPENGSVPHGVVVSTDNFTDNLSGEPISPLVRKPVRNKIPFKPYSDDLNRTLPSAPEGSNYIIDPNFTNYRNSDVIDPITVKSFQGFSDPGSYIPPDPYFAAGPTHVIGVDNGRFRIYDKNGSIVKTINADSWFSSALPSAGCFDPKVLYDHFAKRWIMVWLDQNDSPARGYYLVSVSDDSIPTGTWYNWAISSDLNGSTPSFTWGDYEGAGFDNQAIYITSNQFQYAGNFQGSKIRVIPKAQLYNNTAGPCAWTDFWDIRDPANTSSRLFGIRPSIIYGSASEYYFLCQAPYGTGTFMSLFKLVNPLTTPSMTAVNVPVTAYNSPVNASQLGGGSPNVESGGFNLRNEPVYRNGFLWGVHSIRSGTGGAYSSVRYVKINTSTNTAVEDAAMGADGYWHFYCSLSVDKDQNVAITYSRSSVNDYIGAFFTTRLSTDPPNTLSGSKLMQNGKANYVKTFGFGRNRWGDYNGAWLDPADQNNFWLFTEYAESPANTWGVWTSLVRLIPFPGAKISTNKDSLNFGTREISTVSDTLKFNVTNIGQDTLLISGIQLNNPQFHLLTSVSYPIKLGFNQSKELGLNFIPSAAGNVFDSLILISNDGLTPQKSIYLKAKAFQINPANAGTIYAITGTQSNGSFISINKTTGNGTLIGLSGYADISGISVRPLDKKIFGCIPGATNTILYRLNSSEGDAYPFTTIPLKSIRSIAFDANNDLYGADVSGNLFRYNLSTGDTLTIGNTAISNLYGIAINPVNGQMWGVSLVNKIYRINKTNAQSVEVGTPGFPITPSIAFNDMGKLYGLAGLGVQVSNLILYDTATGTASLIGSTGFQAVNSLAISPQTVGIENITGTVPVSYNLYQNYPNPFNPSTSIQFDIPSSSFATLIVYDALGREIAKLVDEKLSAGTYRYTWNGANLSSGIYFYRLKTSDAADGVKEYTSVKKMLLIK